MTISPGKRLIGLAMRMDAAARQKYLHERAEGREAAIAYQLADAMLRERAARTEIDDVDVLQSIT